MQDSGFWEVGTLTKNESNWDIQYCSNLGLTNEGTSTVTVNGMPIKPGGSFPVTQNTAILNTTVKVTFSGGGNNLLRYSFIRRKPCNNE
ncbi:hypothetical protein [Nonlabens xiamenensis]|uniref:hypothetical protein n=1 Tax=Nonlabens xiamenensis TaxID=2341043 RepID=UPI000F6102C0|nr:hypothetical protein [Nonlabens xiamenensis]